ncbi:MAG: 2-C-methyl-D-erythritol 2,4-cyclodiphosphate synthase [Arenimonas sp.]|nr:2-C-methyl-D-erythritol 2,4-cyclodiphosphate synthase [Arenimonas sp.]MBP7981520.1 2-C-methyl-D-erythritol 2,4-cyclodiphosphate synthase [Arenimonas sp.]
MRIGSGFDVHAFTAGDSVTLGGVHIAHSQGLLAHSDGDVLIHALCDALLGALALGDIGVHFPPGEARWKDADSAGLLAQCMLLVRDKGFELGNADMTVVCEAPKINPHVPAMRARLAAVMQVDIDRLSVKATTTEKLGFTGRGEGIAAQATVLLEKK